MLKFERLTVWQKAVELTGHVHEVTKGFPKDETHILTRQMKRAADSVALNIAEGSTGQTNAEFKQFLAYAIRSAIAVVACLHIGRKRPIVSHRDFDHLYPKVEEVMAR